MDLMCEMTMKELTKAQVAELINFGNAIQNMRKKENRMRIQIMCSFNKPPMVS